MRSRARKFRQYPQGREIYFSPAVGNAHQGVNDVRTVFAGEGDDGFRAETGDVEPPKVAVIETLILPMEGLGPRKAIQGMRFPRDKTAVGAPSHAPLVLNGIVAKEVGHEFSPFIGLIEDYETGPVRDAVEDGIDITALV